MVASPWFLTDRNCRELSGLSVRLLPLYLQLILGTAPGLGPSTFAFDVLLRRSHTTVLCSHQSASVHIRNCSHSRQFATVHDNSRQFMTIPCARYPVSIPTHTPHVAVVTSNWSLTDMPHPYRAPTAVGRVLCGGCAFHLMGNKSSRVLWLWQSRG